MAGISPKQFGMTPVPMPTPKLGGSMGSPTKPTKMITPKLGGSMGSPTKPVKMPTKIFGRG
jgi:hypothetical protein